ERRPLTARARQVLRRRRAPSRRKLVEGGDVEVAVDRERERARDRRRRHDEKVRQVVTLPDAELHPLRDPEAMLLVDDGEAELGEPDALGEERVRADEEVDRAGGEEAEGRLADAARRRRGEELSAG